MRQVFPYLTIPSPQGEFLAALNHEIFQIIDLIDQKYREAHDLYRAAWQEESAEIELDYQERMEEWNRRSWFYRLFHNEPSHRGHTVHFRWTYGNNKRRSLRDLHDLLSMANLMGVPQINLTRDQADLLKDLMLLIEHQKKETGSTPEPNA